MFLKMKINDLELRSCDENLTSIKEHSTCEIVKWEKSSCYTVAFWKENNECFDLKFVGNRPFSEDKDNFWKLAKIGQDFLESIKDIT